MSDRPTPSKSSKPKKPPYPGMLGDETEEQNLNQPGDPKARITRDEVEDTFKKAPTPRK